MDLDKVAARVHSAIQGAMNQEELGFTGMLQSWYFIGVAIDEDGDERITTLSDDNSRVARSLGLVHYARVHLEEQIRTAEET